MKKRCEYSTELCGKIQILSEGYTHEKIAGRLKIPKLSASEVKIENSEITVHVGSL